MPVSKQPRRRLIGRAMARDHVGRDCPRRSAKAEQGNSRIEVRLDATQRLEHRGKNCLIHFKWQAIDRCLVRQRLQLRSLAHRESHGLAQGMRNDQDIREQDRRVESKAADRLQGDLGGHFRIEAELEERTGLCSQRAILRQIATGLSHHPDWRLAACPPVERFENGVTHRLVAHLPSLKPYLKILRLVVT